MNRLQKVINAAARVVCLVTKFDLITPTLMRLHWLPVKHRVIFKIVLSVYKALHGFAPKYIGDMLTYKQSNNYSLRSNEQMLLHVPIESLLMIAPSRKQDLLCGTYYRMKFGFCLLWILLR